MDHNDGVPSQITATVTASVAHARRDAARSSLGNADLLAADVLEMHDVDITDARPIATRLDIDVDGFVLRERASAVSDFPDPLSPTSAVTRPASTASSMSATVGASRPGKAIERPETCSSGGGRFIAVTLRLRAAAHAACR